MGTVYVLGMRMSLCQDLSTPYLQNFKQIFCMYLTAA